MKKALVSLLSFVFFFVFTAGCSSAGADREEPPAFPARFQGKATVICAGEEYLVHLSSTESESVITVLEPPEIKGMRMKCTDSSVMYSLGGLQLSGEKISLPNSFAADCRLALKAACSPCREVQKGEQNQTVLSFADPRPDAGKRNTAEAFCTAVLRGDGAPVRLTAPELGLTLQFG